MVLDLFISKEEAINRGFEEERKFHYRELPDVSKELVEIIRSGVIENFIMTGCESQECVLYVKR